MTNVLSTEAPDNPQSPTAYHQLLIVLACEYHKLLTCIDWQDAVLIAGIREGLTKFLSNTFLHILQGRGRAKHRCSQLASIAAVEQLKKGDYKRLRFEHIVPKTKYIQEPCERKAQGKELSEKYVLDLIHKYWVIASVTEDEDRKLPKKMPDEWDTSDVLARYRQCDIRLIRNPLFVMEWSPSFALE